ncbi:MAG TPA: DNA starvation/stationary phase protection protein [Aestuariivirga sp.]|nr:DNA starvation/stationary phase protection protein [Aestuariivirga sp.]
MSVTKMVEPRDVDLPAKDRRALAKKVGQILQSTYELLLASQLVHWNVKGELFLPVHQLTEQHYESLFATLDILAERMRALGAEVPSEGATKSFSVSSRLDGSTMVKMVDQLIAMHEEAAKGARDVAIFADEAEDPVTNDMMMDCLKFHEKAIWMLRAIVSK